MLRWRTSLLFAAQELRSFLPVRHLCSDVVVPQKQESPAPGGPDAESPMLSVKPELVEQYLSMDVMSKAQKLRAQKPSLIAQYQRHAADVGSSEVQVALLTARIRSLEQHFAEHRKDKHTLRGLQVLINRRKALLQYLRRSNFDRYSVVLHKLQLRDIYAKQNKFDSYRVGTNLKQPTSPLKRFAKGTR